jgi:putative nucleotidyltransferase with HDIG domain
VTELAVNIGRAMGLKDPELNTLHRGALLHDIGKVGVAASILDKNGKLTDEEFTAIKNHPQIGARILEPITSFADILKIVVQHHERYDGSGYPKGLKGEQIYLGARIVAVADVFEAVTANRPYRAGWKTEKAAKMIEEGSGTHFDPVVVDAFLGIITKAKARRKDKVAAKTKKKRHTSAPYTKEGAHKPALTPVVHVGDTAIQGTDIGNTHS